MDEVIVIVEGVEYKLSKEKLENLKRWLNKNSQKEIEPTDELVIDIESAKGLEIEFDETKQKKKEEDEKSHEK